MRASAALDTYLSTLQSNLEVYLDRLVELNCPQTSLLILRFCLSACKFVYASRTIPPELITPSSQRHHIVLRDAVSLLVGAPISDGQWHLALNVFVCLQFVRPSIARQTLLFFQGFLNHTFEVNGERSNNLRDLQATDWLAWRK